MIVVTTIINWEVQFLSFFNLIYCLIIKQLYFRYFQTFWKTSDDFWQQKWNSLLELGDHKEFYIIWLGTFAYLVLLCWVIGTVYILIDCTKKLAFLSKYKIQKDALYPEITILISNVDFI